MRDGRGARSRRGRFLLLAVLAAAALGASAGPGPLSPEGRRALQAVSADSLRAHLSFLASDALGGRVTPSVGQDVAAEYVAAQMRGAGLEPLGDDGYFQSVPGVVATPSAEGFRFTIATGAETVEIPPEAFETTAVAGFALDDLPVVKVPPGPAEAMGAVEGRAVLTELEEIPPGPARREASARRRGWLRVLAEAHPSLVVVVDARRPPAGYFLRPALVEPAPSIAPVKVVTTSAPALVRAYDSLPAHAPAGRLTLHVAEPRREPVTLRNVAGLLRGSDPDLARTYVLASAHYDGTGPQPGAAGPDRIWNAANDDGSGTVTLLELAGVLGHLQPRPRRSIAFVAFFGEEKGELGSRHYAAHPLVPLERTIAAVNLEHLGRTDSAEGSRAGTASLTGFDYSDLPALFQAAGRAAGIEVYRDARRSDPFFTASDNYPLAQAGVVAHTLCVLFEDFADYHGPGDEWPKIDYPNLERTARLVGAGLLMLADSPREPRWREDVPAAAPFREAWRQRHGR